MKHDEWNNLTFKKNNRGKKKVKDTKRKENTKEGVRITKKNYHQEYKIK
jgi:hypothetical protein